MRLNVERKTAEVYQMFNNELKKVKSEFDRHKKDPPLPMHYVRRLEYLGLPIYVVANSLASRVVRSGRKAC